MGAHNISANPQKMQRQAFLHFKSLHYLLYIFKYKITQKIYNDVIYTPLQTNLYPIILQGSGKGLLM